MVEKEHVVVSIFADGTASLETKGVDGSDCVQFSKELEKALGSTGEVKYTSDYYKKGREKAVLIKGM